MAFFQGNASSPADLLTKLRTHAASVGWITDRAGADEWLCHTAPRMVGGVLTVEGYWSVKCSAGINADPTINAFGVTCNTGYSGALLWDRQPGTSAVRPGLPGQYSPSKTLLELGPYTGYTLFATATYLHLVLEQTSNVFRHFQMGLLDKRGLPPKGGAYAFNHRRLDNGVRLDNSGTLILLPVGSGLPSCTREGGQIGPDGIGRSNPVRYRDEEQTPVFDHREGYGLGGGYDSPTDHVGAALVRASPNALGSRTSLIPNTVYIERASNRYSLLGEVPDFAICRLDSIAPGEIITLGADDWYVYPAYKVGSLDQRGTSGKLAYAYKRVN